MFKRVIEVAERELKISIIKKVRHQVIRKHTQEISSYGISSMCKLLGYSKQSYYKKKDTCLKDAFIHTQVKQMVMGICCQLPRLGGRKLYYIIKPELEQRAIIIGRDKLFSLLREQGLLIVKRRKYTKTTHSKHWMKKYKNVIQDIELNKPEQLWVADITYLQTKQGHEYLHLITDAYSKQIMG